jgi:hypothetical protein
MGYCGALTCGTIRVWRVGAASAVKVGEGASGSDVALAPAPNGRLWAVWHRSNRIYARRSSPGVGAFGATVSVAPPAGTIDTYQLDAEEAEARSTSS